MASLPSSSSSERSFRSPSGDLKREEKNDRFVCPQKMPKNFSQVVKMRTRNVMASKRSFTSASKVRSVEIND